MQGLGLDLGLQKSGLKSAEVSRGLLDKFGKRTTRRRRVAEVRGEKTAFLRVLRDSAFSFGGGQDAGVGHPASAKNPGHSLVLPE